MDGQNFREFIERYSEYVLKNQNISDGEKDPIMTHDGNESHGDNEKWCAWVDRFDHALINPSIYDANNAFQSQSILYI